MNICYVATDTNFSDRYGYSTHVVECVRNLYKLGNKVYLFTRSAPGIQLDEEDIHIFRGRGLNINRFIVLSHFLHTFFMLLRICKKNNIEIIYERYHPFGPGVIAGKILGLPTIAEVNGITYQEANLLGYLQKKIAIKCLKYLDRFGLFWPQRIVAVTHKMRSVLVEDNVVTNEDKIVVIENGANTDLFMPADKKFCRNKLDLSQGYHYVLFVGHLFPWHGLEYLIKSAPLILKELPDTKFLIVGDGMMKLELMMMVEKLNLQDKFIFKGSVPYDKVPAYINASDICVVLTIPLKSGCSPLKLYEYLACARPVVASRVDGVELLEKNCAGLLVEPKNPEMLANAVIRLLKDENLRNEMGKNGREIVMKEHSWYVVAKKIEVLCRQTIERFE